MSFISILLKGGWLMLPIFLSSIIAIAILVERFLLIRSSKINVAAFMVKIRGFLKKRDIKGAMALCSEEKSPTATIVRKGLKKYNLGHERVKEAIENAGKQEVIKLERGISMLATISGVAPLLGFLGTVTGMISAFMKIQDLEGAANPADLAGGIWEALITTAFGLAVGIIALGAYNFLTSLIKRAVNDMEVVSNDVVDTLEEVIKGYKGNDDFDQENY